MYDPINNTAVQIILHHYQAVIAKLATAELQPDQAARYYGSLEAFAISLGALGFAGPLPKLVPAALPTQSWKEFKTEIGRANLDDI